jgi:CheY-like chemotaxis protein
MRQSAKASEDYHVQEMSDEFDAIQSYDHALNLLVADDDPAVLDLLANYFARLGFDVDTASDGIQAFLKVRRDKPNILVIDVNMPELDGLSVCAHLFDADRAPPNVIVITGSKNPHTLQRCERVGTYHARKGPNFWNDLEAALSGIDPRMARRIREATSRDLDVNPDQRQGALAGRA